MAIKPIRIPRQVARALGVIPYVYLGLSVLGAATGTAFLICRFDPFVGFFRLSAGFEMLIFGFAILLLGIFIARPYCRFLCPYGALMRIASYFSRHHVTISPAECVECRLCEQSCPIDAIEKPTPADPDFEPRKAVRRFALLIVLVPVLMAGFGFLGSSMHAFLARSFSSEAALAVQIDLENRGILQGNSVESKAFRESGTPIEVLNAKAKNIDETFAWAGGIFGAFVGLVVDEIDQPFPAKEA